LPASTLRTKVGRNALREQNAFWEKIIKDIGIKTQ